MSQMPNVNGAQNPLPVQPIAYATPGAYQRGGPGQAVSPAQLRPRSILPFTFMAVLMWQIQGGMNRLIRQAAGQR